MHEEACDSLLCTLDGYTKLPPGRIANVVTYLEMRSPPPPRARREDLRLRPFDGDRAAYRSLFRRVGEPWLWNGRLRLSDSALDAVLADPAVEVLELAPAGGGRAIGLLELDRSGGDEVEIAYIGVVPEETGRGAGRFLVDEAIARAFASPIARLHLHTCTFDHPRAIAFYRAAGFKPCGFAIEIMEDPRLSGVLPATAAPHVPLVVPAGHAFASERASGHATRGGHAEEEPIQRR